MGTETFTQFRSRSRQIWIYARAMYHAFRELLDEFWGVISENRIDVIVIATTLGALLLLEFPGLCPGTSFQFAGSMWSVRTAPTCSAYAAVIPDFVGSLLQIILGVALTTELLAVSRDIVDRDRLNSPQEVVEFYTSDSSTYKFSSELITPENYVNTDEFGSRIPEKLPVVENSIPQQPTKVDELDAYCLETDFYPLPDRMSDLFGPFIDTVAERFREEGNFNQYKLRPIAIHGTTFYLGQTTFFNNYACNLSPDSTVFDKRTPRQLLHTEVFDSTGELRSLTDTNMPYIAASSGLVFTTNGETVLPVRGSDVVIQGRTVGESFGGSWDWDTVANENSRMGSISKQVEEEFEGERDINVDKTTFWYLGTMRRIDLMGKPDTYVAAVVDEQPQWSEISDEHVFSIVVDVLPENDETDEAKLDRFLQHHETVCARVLAAVADSPYRPSAGLLTWLWLFSQHGQHAGEPPRTT